MASLDIRVRSFDLPTGFDVEQALHSEIPSLSFNGDGETVLWPLARILAIEERKAGMT